MGKKQLSNKQRFQPFKQKAGFKSSAKFMSRPAKIEYSGREYKTHENYTYLLAKHGC